MDLLRIALAFLVAPLISPLAGLLVYSFHSGSLPSAVAARRLFWLYGILAYVLTAIFGLPVFLLLRYSRFGGKLAAAVSGGLIALAAGFVLFGLAPLFFTANNVKGYITWSLTGAASGLLFWLIAAGIKANGGSFNTPRGEI